MVLRAYLILTNRKICFKHSSTFETGLSDHHHLIYSMLKTTLKKEEPKLYKYRDYKKCDRTAFHTDFQSKLEEGPKVYQNFEETFVRVLDAHGPKKLRFYMVIINLMLTKLFVKAL